MYKHRLVFLGTWLLGVALLLIFPGYEAKGFVFGLIIGYWPFAAWGELSSHGVIFFIMLALSATEMGLCAWMMDKFQVSRKFWYVMLSFILVGLIWLFCLNVRNFDSVRGSAAIQAAENSPELNYEFNRSDFNRWYLIPKTIVGGMYGLYFATAFGLFFAFGLGIRKMSTWYRKPYEKHGQYLN